MKILKSFLILAIFFLITLTGCSNNQIESGSRGVFSINIGGSGSSARALTDAEKAALTYIIRLTDGPAEDIEETIIGFGQRTFSVPVGQWKISVEAKNGDKLVASGSTTANIKPGSNGTISITMEMSSDGGVPIEPNLPDPKDIKIEVYVGEGDNKTPIKEGVSITITEEDTIITVDEDAFDDIRWYIAEESDEYSTDWDGHPSITLSANMFDEEGIYLLTISALVDGKWYSREIVLIVEELPPEVKIDPNFDAEIELLCSDGAYYNDEGILTITGDEVEISVKKNEYDYTIKEWSIVGKSDIELDNGTEVTLSKDNFELGIIYHLTLFYWVNDVLYSQWISFKFDTP